MVKTCMDATDSEDVPGFLFNTILLALGEEKLDWDMCMPGVGRVAAFDLGASIRYQL